MRPVLVQRLGHLHPGIVRVHRRPAAQAAPRSGRGQPRPRPFLNQPPLKLRQGRKDIKHQLARRRRRITRPVANRPFADTPWGRAQSGPFFAAPLRYSHTS